jgi:hypothetical protein
MFCSITYFFPEERIVKIVKTVRQNCNITTLGVSPPPPPPVVTALGMCLTGVGKRRKSVSSNVSEFGRKYFCSPGDGCSKLG